MAAQTKQDPGGRGGGRVRGPTAAQMDCPRIDHLCAWPSPPLVGPQHLWLPRYGTETKNWPPPTAAEEAKNYCLQQRRRTTTKTTTAAAQRWRTGKNGPVRGPAGPLGALVQPEPPPPAGAVAPPPSRSRRVLAESRSTSRQKTIFINLPPSHRLSDCFRGAERTNFLED